MRMEAKGSATDMDTDAKQGAKRYLVATIQLHFALFELTLLFWSSMYDKSRRTCV